MQELIKIRKDGPLYIKKYFLEDKEYFLASDLIEMGYKLSPFAPFCFDNKRVEDQGLIVNYLILVDNLKLSVYNTKEQKSIDVFTYFILCSRTNSVKIGIAKDIDSRLKVLQTANPFQLSILDYTEGNIEKTLHKKFEHLKTKGEWFKYSDEIKSYLLELKEFKENAIGDNSTAR